MRGGRERQILGRMNTTTPHTSRDVLYATLVSDVMTTGVINCTPDTPLPVVAALMTKHRVHAIYVFDYGEEADETVQLWGLVSDLDLVASAYGPIEERTAGETAITPLLMVRDDDTVARAAQLMIENGVSHLAVVDSTTSRPVGVLSSLDVAGLVAAKDHG
jgi:CBS domain-containing protein